MWDNSTELPVDKVFLDTFDVQNRQQQRNPSISMFFTCASTMTINAIKYHDLVWPVIGVEGIYMYPDKFDREVTASPGFLIKVHPRLAWKEGLIEEIQRELLQVELPQNDKVVQNWKSQNPAATTDSLPFLH